MSETKTPTEADRKAFCDLIVVRAADLMIEGGAPIAMMLDRLLTYATAQACTIDGSPRTAKALRQMADKIDAGIFHKITGESSSGHQVRH